MTARAAKGISRKTLQTYASHFKAVQKHLNVDLTFAELTSRDFDEMVVSMRKANLAQNSISSYVEHPTNPARRQGPDRLSGC